MAMLLAAVTLRKYLVAGPAKKGIMRYIDTSANKVGSILMVIGCGGCFAKVITQTGIGRRAGEHVLPLQHARAAARLPARHDHPRGGRLRHGRHDDGGLHRQGPAIALQGCSPVLVGLAVCAGTVGLTLPTDGAFWHPSQLNGISINETMVVTVSTTLASVVAFAIILLINCFSGFLPGLF